MSVAIPEPMHLVVRHLLSLTTVDVAYGTNTLAGGDFYWVATAGGDAEAKGHNVVTESLSARDTAAFTATGLPPGFDGAIATAADVGSTWATNDLTCAGTYGCHGNPALGSDDFVAMSGAHHGAEAATAYRAGGSLADSYRFLLGIKGVEDADWEFTSAADDHNQYHGDARDSAQIASDTPADATTISALCARCHGDFHSNDGGIAYLNDITNSWLRHPTDFDMNASGGTSEYASYGGATNAYQVEAPVASEVADATVRATVLQSAGDAIVTCISCHRAHGSPHDDLMRWDYDPATTAMIAGTTSAGNAGCFNCHTTKDD